MPRPWIALLAVPLAFPASTAAVPVLAPLKPCYVSARTVPGQIETEQVIVGGSGFTPGALVDVVLDDRPVATGIGIDALGVLPAGAVSAPAVRRGQRAFTITVTERANPAQTVTVRSLVSDLSVTVRPRTAAPDRRVTFVGRGFTDLARPVFGHYVRHNRSRRTVRLSARPQGPCGTFRVRRRQFPFEPAFGRWILQLDQRRRYAVEPPFLQVAIDVG